MRVALVSAEVSPFVGGGIAPSLRATAQALAAAGHHVDLFTRARYRPEAARAVHDGLAVLQHARIQWHWVPEPPNDAEHWHREMAEAFNTALAQAYAHQSPALVELQDYQGLGATIAVDRAGGALGDAIVVTRLHTSSEQIAHLDAVAPVPELCELERICLVASDLLVGPSDAVFAFYRDFYRDLELAPSVALWPGFLRDDAPTRAAARPTGHRLELLALGRYQRCKGTDRLVRALVESPDLPIHLTLVGADTPTGPSGSMRDYVRDLAEDDPRVSAFGPVPRSETARFLERADALIVSSLWETWGNVGLEALAGARPLLATPCPSMAEMAGDGRFGIIATGHGIEDLAQLLRDAVEQRGRLADLAGDPALLTHLDKLTDESHVVAGYEALALRPERAARQPSGQWFSLANGDTP